MAKKIKGSTIGAWAFLIGIVIAVSIGVFSSQIIEPTQKIVVWILIFLGLVIGLLNITNKESSGFLLVSVALVIVSYFGRVILMIIPILGNVLWALLILFIPTTIIVALKSVFEMAKN
jgi:uncharacterized membrane protein YccC